MHDLARRILVVEDNPALSKVLAINLKNAGFDVSTAHNGQVALDLVREEQFDLIVTDMQMPLMDGCEFCSNMRQIDSYADVPVFLLTAKGMELDLPKMRDELGITATYAKPFSPAAIVQEIRDCLAPTT